MRTRRLTIRGGDIKAPLAKQTPRRHTLALLAIGAVSMSAGWVAAWSSKNLDGAPSAARGMLAAEDADSRRRAVFVLLADTWQTVDALAAARSRGDEQAAIALSHLRDRLSELR